MTLALVSTVLLALPVLEVVKSEMMPPMPTALSLLVLLALPVLEVVKSEMMPPMPTALSQGSEWGAIRELDDKQTTGMFSFRSMICGNCGHLRVELG